MDQKRPALLVVLIETARLRWFVATIALDGLAIPLLRSEPGDLQKYQGLDFDGQLSFLRHRFCGVLQRGCDRLWSRNLKACQFVFVFEGLLPESAGTLTQAVAEHLTQWMLNPPVAVFNESERLAGELDPLREQLLFAQLPGLRASREEASAWELIPRKVES